MSAYQTLNKTRKSTEVKNVIFTLSLSSGNITFYQSINFTKKAEEAERQRDAPNTKDAPMKKLFIILSQFNRDCKNENHSHSTFPLHPDTISPTLGSDKAVAL